MRRGTLITLIVLLVTLVVVAVIQIRLATRTEGRFPGGTEPTASP